MTNASAYHVLSRHSARLHALDSDRFVARHHA